ncbi:MAG: hypothetical protein PHV66_08035 [Bacteroidales bacterium]|nr:hypothetical protein [Bacteroidales bacterium]
MKKKLFFNLMAAITVFAMPCVTSCSDDSEDGEKGGGDIVTFTEAKQLFESNGLNVVNALEGLKNEEGMAAMASLSAVMPMMQNTFMAESYSALAMQPMAGTSLSMIHQNIDTRMLNPLLGTYVFNEEAKTFDFNADETKQKMVMKFPASKTATTNTGTATLSYTTYSLNGVPIPQTLSAVIKVGSKNVMTASIAMDYAKYDTMTMHKGFAMKWGMGKFATGFELKDQTTKSTAEFFVSVSDKKMISIAAAAAGTTLSNGLDGQQIISKTKAIEVTGILGELSIVGKVVDGPAFIRTMDSISSVANEIMYQNYSDTAARYAALRPVIAAEAAYINQNLSIKLISGKSVIATFQAAAKANLDEGWLDTNAVFADGTKSSIEDFGQSQEMGNIMARATEVIQSLKASFMENTPVIE